MDHGSSAEWGVDHAARFKTNLGLRLFTSYTLVYFGFVFLNTLSPATMGLEMIGLNLAIVYGFGLILFALLLAFVYNAKCTRAEERLDLGARHINDWYDRMHAQHKLPKHWDKARVLAFMNTLNGVDAELTDERGKNIQILEAFRLLAEGEDKP
jgi:uncharacterized membrane protein (DUF485 family)